ncbi:YihY/virulence factor BrkB family protein [Georgenia sp. 10Sc9-8]|uniref:YihY/virulence factor BrkB family protein n=1 Tax=Georgenia halotolerans TaxID=3028317 RepID=A0ABT5U1Z1_9MICO|nr:YihY/virulence factor BrkB family protein [Georgenia halotolerans]
MQQVQAPRVGRRPSRRFIAGKAVREFFADECWDRAAAMTFFSVLSIPPLAVALASLLALVGQGRSSTQAVLDILSRLTPDDEALETVTQPVLAVLEQPAAGLSLLAGVLTALWTSAGYVGAFGRALNTVYGVPEGRPLGKLLFWHLLTTVVLVVFAALVALMLVISGPVTEAIGDVLGLGDTVVLAWELARWPVLLLVAVLVVALLYYATPNVAHPRFRWISTGSVVALVIAAVVSYTFRLYVGMAGRFEITYGAALAGIVVFFIWLWIINMSLLLGAELDTEIQRARQLRAGVRADRAVQVPLRDARASERAAQRRQSDEDRARSLRESWHGKD